MFSGVLSAVFDHFSPYGFRRMGQDDEEKRILSLPSALFNVFLNFLGVSCSASPLTVDTICARACDPDSASRPPPARTITQKDTGPARSWSSRVCYFALFSYTYFLLTSYTSELTNLATAQQMKVAITDWTQVC